MTEQPDTSRPRPLATRLAGWLSSQRSALWPSAVSTPEVTAAPAVGSVGLDLAEVERFLYREARLLDDRRWDDWLALWDGNGTYSMPTRHDVRGEGVHRAVEAELVGPDGVWWFDEGPSEMALRIAKLRTEKAWAEEPPSRTRRFVSNVELMAAGPDLNVVRSNVLVYRGRRDSDVEWFSAARTDELRRDGDAIALVNRRVILDQKVVVADNLMMFF